VLHEPATCPLSDGQHGLPFVDDGKVACETGAPW